MLNSSNYSTGIYRIPTMVPIGLNQVPSFRLNLPLLTIPSAATTPRRRLPAGTPTSTVMPTYPLDPPHGPHTIVRSTSHPQ